MLNDERPATTGDGIAFEKILPAECEAILPQLAALHHKAVHYGANLGFLLPFPLEEANAYWQSLLPKLLAGKQTIFIARTQDGSTVGCAVLTPDARATFPQRAEVGKLIVDPTYRRRGIAGHLMCMLEKEAVARGHWKLVSCDFIKRYVMHTQVFNTIVQTLRTPVGAEREDMYRSWGWKNIGYFPDRAMCWDKSRIVTLAGFQKDLREESASIANMKISAAKVLNEYNHIQKVELETGHDSTKLEISAIPYEKYGLSTEKLSHLLGVCVHAGASAGLYAPVDREVGIQFWTSRDEAIRSGSETVLLAHNGDILVGCALLKLNALPVATHRADVTHVLVHPQYMTRGPAGGYRTGPVAIECQTDSVLDGLLHENPRYYKAGILDDCGVSPDGDKFISITYWVGDLRSFDTSESHVV